MAIETSSPVLPGSQGDITSSRSPSQESSTSDFDSILHGVPILADGETEAEAEEPTPSTKNHEDSSGLIALLNTSVPLDPGGIVTSTGNDLFTSFSEGEGMPVEGKAEFILSSEEFLRLKGLLAGAGTGPEGKAGQVEPGQPATVVEGGKGLGALLNSNVPQTQAGLVTSFSEREGMLVEGKAEFVLSSEELTRLKGLLAGRGTDPVEGKAEFVLSSGEFLRLKGLLAGTGTNPEGRTGALVSSTSNVVSSLVNGEVSGRDNVSRTTELPVFAGVDSSGSENRSQSFSDGDSLLDTSKSENASNISYSLTSITGGDQNGAGTEGKNLLGSSASLQLTAKDTLVLLNEQGHPDGTRSLGAGSVAQPLPVISETSTLGPRPSPEVWHSVIDRVAGEMFTNLRQNRQGALIQLEPPELGRVKIELLIQGDQVKARIVTEMADVKTLIQAHLPDLRQALQAHRLDLGEVRVDVSGWDRERGEGPEGFQQESKTHQGKGQESGFENQSSMGEDQQSAGTEIPGSNRDSGVSVWA